MGKAIAAVSLAWIIGAFSPEAAFGEGVLSRDDYELREKIRLSPSSFAAHAGGDRPDDNWLWLEPGERRTIRYRFDDGVRRPIGKVQSAFNQGE